MPTYEVPNWLKGRQIEAAAKAEQMGLPSSRDEGWRYTSLDKYSKINFIKQNALEFNTPKSEIVFPPGLSALEQEADVVVCFLNGRLVEQNSRGMSVAGIEIVVSLDQLLARTNVTPEIKKTLLRAPNENLKKIGWSAIAQNQWGAVVHMKGAQKQPLRIAIAHLYKNNEEAPMATSIKNIYILEEGIQAEVLEAHYSLDNSIMQIQNMSDVVLAQSSALKFGQFTEMGHNYFFNDTQMTIGGHATAEILSLTAGGGIVRNEYEVRLCAEGAKSTFLSLATGEGESHTVNSSTIIHEKGETQSVQLSKSIMKDSSQFVFSGRLVINQDAQKSDASQYNHNLLLSEKAEVNTRPQLEVFADDVKAAHGATVGSLQESELFYLQSRAISRAQAMRMLVSGYANDLFERTASSFLVSTARHIMSMRSH